MTTVTYTTKSAQETQYIAREFAKELHGGELILLVGDLGTGKTTFVQGLVAELAPLVRVKSPTFTVMHEYPVQDHAVIHSIIHCDLYRFTTAMELRALSLEECQRSETIVLIEWPNILVDIAWKPTVTITFTHGLEDNSRTILVTWS